MDEQSSLENEQDRGQKIESGSGKIESKAEASESQMIKGAELLETPTDGDFVVGLRAFISWALKVVAKDE